ncbi:ABC transporter permease [Georgenia faecalis]|uniref:Autoinducer 2 import system permease protein LsrD n=1 Tax=Georgenia faecalis TaxID=2483799 RepID=A0ABV9DEJ8_9MICO|nr:ABC transporter permease [Georgenia faecalis]
MSADTSTRVADTAPLAPARPRTRRGALTWDTAIIAVTLAFLVAASLGVEHFGTARNFGFLVLDLAPIFLLALPMTLIVITGDIDLSVASMVGLTSSAIGVMWEAGMPLETILVLAVVLGAVLGAVNGFFVAVLGLPALAVTIGTLALYRGLAYVLLGEGAVATFPRSFTGWTVGATGWMPNVLPGLLLLAVVFAVVLHATPVGRSIYAIGANVTTAAYSGINVGRTRFLLFVASGAMAGLVGAFWTLRYSSARGDNAFGIELTVVAAVLLGGVSIFGGKGSLPGVLAGVVLLMSLQNALRLGSVSTEALTVVTGLLLIVSVLLPNVLVRIRRMRSPRRPADPVPDPAPHQPAAPAANERN